MKEKKSLQIRRFPLKRSEKERIPLSASFSVSESARIAPRDGEEKGKVSL